MTDNAAQPAPTYPTTGVNWIIVGSTVAVLAPLARFLGGSVVGTGSSGAKFEPLYLWLFIGMFIGGIGAVIAILGGRTS